MPAGDQPTALNQLERALRAGQKHVLLHGATGTGKTFVMAHTIARAGKPALVLCPNKTLAAQARARHPPALTHLNDSVPPQHLAAAWLPTKSS